MSPYLAGFAAEHLLTARRPRTLDVEVGLGLLAHLDPYLSTQSTAFGQAMAMARCTRFSGPAFVRVFAVQQAHGLLPAQMV
jgi:hypothetical protein